MDQLLLKATTVAADEGVFEAVISTATIDRERDIVEPQAMVDALSKYVALGKRLPLVWNHSLEPADQIGYIEPGSAKAIGGEVVVAGWIDQSTDRGTEVWRLVKTGTLGFSFGYLITAATERKGGGRHITGLDVFEATATNAPMNGDTRVLSWKSMRDELAAELEQINERLKALEELQTSNAGQAPEKGRSPDPLEQKARSLVMELMADGAKPPTTVNEEPEPRPDMDPEALKRRSRDLIVSVLNGGIT